MVRSPHDLLVELDRHGLAQLELLDEVVHRRAVRQIHCFAVDTNMHGRIIIGLQGTMRTRQLHLAAGLALASLLGGCSEPVYDTSTPQAMIDSLHQMIVDERAGEIASLIHIDSRPEMIFEDGVTEVSAIEDVRIKARDMLDQLFRVARKLRERYPGQVDAEIAQLIDDRNSFGAGPWVARFLTNPFGLMEEQRRRLSAEDLGDGTAALLVDGEAMSAVPLRLVEIDGEWRIEIPIELLNEFRPNTRHEWAVVASMMLAIENSLSDFERELDDGEFRDLAHAGERAGRMLGESIVVQGLIYRLMKRNVEEAADTSP